MSNAKSFDLYSILAVTHRLPSTALQYRTILAHIMGIEVEQMTGAGMAALTVAPECARWLLEQHPQLRDIPAPPDFHEDTDAMDAWAAEQVTQLGADRLLVAPLPPERNQHPSLDDVLDVIAEIRGGLNAVVIIDPTKPDFGLGKPAED